MPGMYEYKASTFAPDAGFAARGRTPSKSARPSAVVERSPMRSPRHVWTLPTVQPRESTAFWQAVGGPGALASTDDGRPVAI